MLEAKIVAVIIVTVLGVVLYTMVVQRLADYLKRRWYDQLD